MAFRSQSGYQDIGMQLRTLQDFGVFIPCFNLNAMYVANVACNLSPRETMYDYIYGIYTIQRNLKPGKSYSVPPDFQSSYLDTTIKTPNI